ncbi:MAG TPA: HupE/UreJ family protein [Steroidobacter sp.]
MTNNAAAEFIYSRLAGSEGSWARLGASALLSGVLLLFAATASADVLKFARFHLLGGKSPNTFELDVQLPFVLTAQPAQDVVLPEGCKVTAQSAQVLAQETSAVIKFACDNPMQHGATIRVPWGEDGGVLTSSLTPDGTTPRMIHGSEDGVALPLDAAGEERSLGAVAAEYTGLGIVHILEGLDHLAFVLCLCLLTRGDTLLLLVTAFTIGHSISLALSFLGIVNIPVPPVEATIALSIAFMAREALLARQGGGGERRLRYMAVVAAFGLLHGLGFASVLGDLGVAPGERIAGLIFFNVGVEIGQLAFVAAVTLLMWLASKVRIDAPLRTAALYGVGVVGVFWTVERVAGFVG